MTWAVVDGIESVPEGPREQDQQEAESIAERTGHRGNEVDAEQRVAHDVPEMGMQEEGRQRAPPLSIENGLARGSARIENRMTLLSAAEECVDGKEADSHSNAREAGFGQLFFGLSRRGSALRILGLVERDGFQGQCLIGCFDHEAESEIFFHVDIALDGLARQEQGPFLGHFSSTRHRDEGYVTHVARLFPVYAAVRGGGPIPESTVMSVFC